MLFTDMLVCSFVFFFTFGLDSHLFLLLTRYVFALHDFVLMTMGPFLEYVLCAFWSHLMLSYLRKLLLLFKEDRVEPEAMSTAAQCQPKPRYSSRPQHIFFRKLDPRPRRGSRSRSFH
jgi:hypothetical protein